MLYYRPICIRIQVCNGLVAGFVTAMPGRGGKIAVLGRTVIMGG